MKTRRASRVGSRQRGSVAVEAALVIPILVILIAFPLLLGRIFWYYATVQSAAHDAARYLANVPIAEMSSPTRGSLAATLAHDIAAAETGELYLGADSRVSITISCNDSNCDAGIPTTVTALVIVRVFDPFFSGYTWTTVGDDGLQLRAKVVMRYAGQ